MPQFKVLLQATCVAVVEAESEDEAMELAIDNASTGDYEFVEGAYKGLIQPDNLEAEKRHANKII